MLKAILISLVSGGVATSLAEYFLNYNLIDKIIDLFRTEEQKVATIAKKGGTVVVNEFGKVKGKF